MDRRYLSTIAMNYSGGPVGVGLQVEDLGLQQDSLQQVVQAAEAVGGLEDHAAQVRARRG